MRKETRALLKQFPLSDGEEVIAEIAGKDASGNLEGLILTPGRIGAWHSGPAFVCPLYMVSDWSFEGTVVRVQWDNGVEHVVDVGSLDEALAFFIALRDARASVMRPECAAGISAGVIALTEGNLQEADAQFRVAVEADEFHPGAGLLLFHLLRWAGDRRGAVDALIRVIEPAMNMEGTSVFLWPSAPFAAIDLYVAGTKLGIEGDVSEFSLGQTLFSALRAARLGNDQEAVQLINLSLAKCAENVGMIPLTLGFASMVLRAEAWPALADIGRRARSASGAEEMRPLLDYFVAALDYPADPITATAASFAFFEDAGNPVPGEALRVHERWAEVLDRRLPDLDEDDLELMAVDPVAFERVRGWLAATYDPARDVEGAWASLRVGRLADAQAFLHEQSGAWYRSIVDAFPKDAFEPWLAGVAETECLLRQGNRREASKLLETVYADRVASFGDGRDLYLRHASNLYGLYKALAEERSADARLYARLLSAEPGFGWVNGVAGALSAPALPAGPVDGRAEIRRFEAWVAGVRQTLQLDSSDRFMRAASQLERARTDRTLRVVIGGETSAGKSSFINALLGEPVLFVTEEEATAVPTSVRRGATWAAEVIDARGQTRERLDVGARPTEADRQRLHAWVRRFTAVASRESEGVAALNLYVPNDAIPEGVAYIDTPGLNAHALRTERAQHAIEDAHACIFVVDAGSALKAGEMAKIRWASSEVGKTIFVLNKMDKAIGDADLDCDESAVDDLLGRMQTELARTLGAEPLIYGVCSLPEARVRARTPEALPFVRKIGEVRGKLSELLRGSHERLILRSAAKVARVAAREALDRATAGVQGFEGEVGRLSQRLPDDPETFREHVSLLTNAVWSASRGEYVDRMQVEMNTAGERCMGRITAGMRGSQDREQLKSFVNNRVRGILNEFVSDVDAARAREWATLGKAMLSEVQELFHALYADAKFTPDFETGDMLQLATQIPLASSVSDLTNAIGELIFEAGAKEMGGVAAGAFIGTMLFPGVGTMIGAWLGGAAGGALNEDFSQKVYDRIQERYSEICDKVADALNNDINPGADGTQPILRAIDDVVDRERTRFDRVLRVEIAKIEAQRGRALLQAEGGRRHVTEAAAWMTQLEAMVQPV